MADRRAAALCLPDAELGAELRLWRDADRLLALHARVARVHHPADGVLRLPRQRRAQPAARRHRLAAWDIRDADGPRVPRRNRLSGVAQGPRVAAGSRAAPRRGLPRDEWPERRDLSAD